MKFSFWIDTRKKNQFPSNELTYSSYLSSNCAFYLICWHTFVHDITLQSLYLSIRSVVMSLFSSLILVIWVFPLFCLVIQAKDLSFLLSFQWNNFSLCWFAILLISTLIFISILLFALSSFCFSFYSFLRSKNGLLIWDLSFFLIQVFRVIDIPSKHLVTLHILWYVCPHFHV